MFFCKNFARRRDIVLQGCCLVIVNKNVRTLDFARSKRFVGMCCCWNFMVYCIDYIIRFQ